MTTLDLPFSGELVPRTFLLPSGAEVDVPVWRTTFSKWTGDRLPESFSLTYRWKPLVDLDGGRLFAELAICKVLITNGWKAVWLDTFHRKRWNQMIDVESPCTIPEPVLVEYGPAVLDKCVWDVFAWNSTRALFLESKGPKDRVSQKQLGWLERALTSGLNLDFLFVEWSFDA